MWFNLSRKNNCFWKKTIPMGEETGIIENFVNKKILEKQSLNLGNCTEVRKELINFIKIKD